MATTVQVSDLTKQILQRFKRPGESYDQYILRLIKAKLEVPDSMAGYYATAFANKRRSWPQ